MVDPTATSDKLKIHAIQTGTVRVKQSQCIGRGRGLMRQLHVLFDSTWTEPLPIYAWAIETAEGVIVVDTGETAKTREPGYFPRWHPYFWLAVQSDGNVTGRSTRSQNLHRCNSAPPAAPTERQR